MKNESNDRTAGYIDDSIAHCYWDGLSSKARYNDLSASCHRWRCTRQNRKIQSIEWACAIRPCNIYLDMQHRTLSSSQIQGIREYPSALQCDHWLMDERKRKMFALYYGFGTWVVCYDDGSIAHACRDKEECNEFMLRMYHEWKKFARLVWSLLYRGIRFF